MLRMNGAMAAHPRHPKTLLVRNCVRACSKCTLQPGDACGPVLRTMARDEKKGGESSGQWQGAGLSFAGRANRIAKRTNQKMGLTKLNSATRRRNSYPPPSYIDPAYMIRDALSTYLLPYLPIVYISVECVPGLHTQSCIIYWHG